MASVLGDWVLARLAEVKDSPRVLVRDSLRLLPDSDGLVHGFATEHGFTVVVASTNLVFRELYEKVVGDPEVGKILVVDRCPARRKANTASDKAPPPFYPDLLAETPVEARVDLDLRQFLRETTRDPNWPFETNDPLYAKLIVEHLDGVLRAHRNLRTADSARFTDYDFRLLVAYAALGVADAAFKKMGPEDYWRVGLHARDALDQLDRLVPEVTKPIKEQLRQAPAPFCWFETHDAETVVRAFYLSAILAQHAENWHPLLANVDPTLAAMPKANESVLKEAAPRLVALDRAQAERDLGAVEEGLSKQSLTFLLLDQLKIESPDGFVGVLAKERYTTLLRSLALLLALDDLLAASPDLKVQGHIADLLFPEAAAGPASLADQRSSSTWMHLKEAYGLAREVRALRGELAAAVKTVKVMKVDQLTFGFFCDLWNGKRLNRLEYYLSALGRLLETGELLPRPAESLPSAFANALHRLREQFRKLDKEVQGQLDELNWRFQDVVAAQYPSWVGGSTPGTPKSQTTGMLPLPLFSDGPVLTSRFLRRCLKPHWDPQKEKAVVLIFDGMRYDIWDELLRPMLADRLEVLEDLPASSLLPSETHITRKAICAGNFGDKFDSREGEDKLLKVGLASEFGLNIPVEVITPETSGTGETVRYRAGNLDVYIFELCDKELHKIEAKTLPDGRVVPSRPLAFLYQQHVKNIVDTEVMSIVRGLVAGTKLFVVADHGFGKVGRQAQWFADCDLNEQSDCRYTYCYLKTAFADADVPPKVRSNVVAFTPQQLRLPATEARFDKKSGMTVDKEYKAVVFPRVGCAFSRKSVPFNPDAYSHGGISLQELLIPMVALRVKAKDAGLLALSAVEGPSEVVEGQEAEYHLTIVRAGQAAAGVEEVRVEVEATYSREPDRFSLPRQVLYVGPQGAEVRCRFRPDPGDASDEERREGAMERTLTIAISYREGHRNVRKSQTCRFTVKLNAEQVVRRVGNLGTILGLTPKSMR